MEFIHLASLNDQHTRKFIYAKSNSYKTLIALTEGGVYAVNIIMADAGIAAQNGTKGSNYDVLLYSSAIALWHLKKYDGIKIAADNAHKALDNDPAHRRFNAAT